MWWSRRSHASEMSYRSSPDGLGPQSELAVLPRPPNVLDAPRRARVSSERSKRTAPRPSLTPNDILPHRHTRLALRGLPSFQRRGSPDSWRVDDVPLMLGMAIKLTLLNSLSLYDKFNSAFHLYVASVRASS